MVGSAIHVPGQAPAALGQFQVTLLLLLLRVLAKLWAWGRWGQPQGDPGQHERRLALTSRAVTTDEFQNAGTWQSLTSCTETAQF